MKEKEKIEFNHFHPHAFRLVLSYLYTKDLDSVLQTISEKEELSEKDAGNEENEKIVFDIFLLSSLCDIPQVFSLSLYSKCFLMTL